MPTVIYQDSQGLTKRLRIKTYALVKHKINAFMNDSFDECISVYRSRRGEWGEWFEIWIRVGKNKKIIKQGWM